LREPHLENALRAADLPNDPGTQVSAALRRSWALAAAIADMAGGWQGPHCGMGARPRSAVECTCVY
jgi:hypothetical protein